MSAFSPSTKYAVSATEDRDEFDRLAVHNLTLKLKIVEQRLGTPAELPGDESLACELGHKICNLLNILQLREEFRALVLVKEQALQQTA